MPTLFTIGHSTLSLDAFLALLDAHAIDLLADIRAFPMSRRHPQFHREALARSLAERARPVAYEWMPALGGRRKRTLAASPNTGLRNESFRNYADYMLTPAFADAARHLVSLAEHRRVAFMCAERMWFQCHRMLVSDWLVAHGSTVLHIVDAGPPRPHALLAAARIIDGTLLYPGPPEQDALFRA